MEAKCQQCKEKFTAKRSTARFCSDRCKLKFNRDKATEDLQGAVEKIEQQLQETPEEAYQRRLKGFLSQLEETEWLETGTELDKASSLPKYKITLIYGKPGIGKTTLAHIVATKVPNTLYIDTESSLTPERLAQLGIEPTRFTLKKISLVEEIYDLLLDDKTLQKYDLIVWDSVANSSCMAEAQSHVEDKMSYLQKPKLINRMMRLLPMKLDTNKTTLLLINQIREDFNQYTPDYPPGGRGHVYSSSLVMRLSGTYPDRVLVDVVKSRVGESKKVKIKL